MTGTAKRPSKRVALFALGGVVAAAIALFLVLYFLVFPTSSPKPFKLTPTTATATTTAAPSSSSVTSTSALTGTWKIAGGSEAGYRVREKLGFLPAESDAVGRTEQVSGSAAFSESAGAGSRSTRRHSPWLSTPSKATDRCETKKSIR